jgi:hypothetical protein
MRRLRPLCRRRALSLRGFGEAEFDQFADCCGAGWEAVGPAVFVDLFDEIWGHWDSDAFGGHAGFSHAVEYGDGQAAGKCTGCVGGVSKSTHFTYYGWVDCSSGVLGLCGEEHAGLGEGAMTAERLDEIIRHCLRVRRKNDLTAFLQDIAAHLRVDPKTLHRWLVGETPIPHLVEIIFETMAAFPEVTAEGVEEIIRQRDAFIRRRDAGD